MTVIDQSENLLYQKLILLKVFFSKKEECFEICRQFLRDVANNSDIIYNFLIGGVENFAIVMEGR